MEDYKKKYEDLFGVIEGLYPNMTKYQQEKLQGVCPEFEESEDEKIRKEIIAYLDVQDAISNRKDGDFKSWIAWLEKKGEQNKQHLYDIIISLWDLLDKIDTFSDLQINDTNPNNFFRKIGDITQERHKFVKSDGYNLYIKGEQITDFKQNDQKSTDNVEPKFKVGNWYYCIKDFFGKGVTFDKNTAYYCAKEGCLQDEYGCHIVIVKDLYDNFKIWTIQDAKDGDVLAYNDGSLTIFHYRLSGLDAGLYMSHVLLTDKIELKQTCAINNVYPATKEQRDTLMKAMADAGYTFDFEKKELKKIEQKPIEWSLPYGKNENETAEKLIALAECLEMDGDCLFNGLSGNDYGKFLRVLATELTEVQSAWSEVDEKIRKNLLNLFHNGSA